jgi:AsmA-like C-terminal region
MTLASRGRSAAALSGALTGSGTVTLEAARIAGLDPRAFEAATRVSDSGQVKDDAKLKQIVEPALAAGVLSIASAQVPFNVRDGRIRVGATTLDANGVRAIVSGGYDIPADQVDVRAALALTTVAGRPEIQLFAVGTSDALNRSVDVAALSSWLSVRAIDHETKRLDAIERGEPPPPAPAPVVLPPQEEVPAPQALPPNEPLTPVPLPGRDPRKLPAKPKAVAPRPQPAPPVATAPAPITAPPRPQQAAPPVVTAPAPVASQQQVAPLPPPIDVKPAPRPKPKPPLALTPQVANPPPRPALQNSN